MEHLLRVRKSLSSWVIIFVYRQIRGCRVQEGDDRIVPCAALDSQHRLQLGLQVV